MVDALPSGIAVPARAAANLKRSLIVAIPCGVVALVGMALLRHPLAGFFVVLGLGFGALNTRMVQQSVVRFRVQESKGGFVLSMVLRLFLLTAAALLAVILVRPDGAGLLAGIAIFQVIGLLSAAIPVFRELRQ